MNDTMLSEYSVLSQHFSQNFRDFKKKDQKTTIIYMQYCYPEQDALSSVITRALSKYLHRAVLHCFTSSVFNYSPKYSPHTGAFVLFYGSPDLLPINMFISNQ